MSRPSTAIDLVRIALASRQAGALRADVLPTEYFARIAVLQLIALLCAAAAPGRGLIAFGMCTSPVLGATCALLVNSAVLCAVGFAALVLRAAHSRIALAVASYKRWRTTRWLAGGL